MTGNVTPEVEKTCERQDVELVRMPASGEKIAAVVDGPESAVPNRRRRARRTA